MTQKEEGRNFSYNYEFIGQRFIANLDFSQQYLQIYHARLNGLRSRTLENAAHENKIKPLENLMDLKQHKKAVIYGTIARYHKAKPSTIQKYLSVVGSIESRPSDFGNYWSENDELWLEDMSGRLLLNFTNCQDDWLNLVTGVQIGLFGIIEHTGTFSVEKLYFPQIEKPIQLKGRGEEYICFVSGLEMGSLGYDHILLNLFSQYIMGNLGQESLEDSRKIIRLVILGDSIYKHDEARMIDRKAIGDASLRGAAELANSIRFLDTFLSELAGVVPVDLIPGDMDPSNSSLPQQPINPHLLPSSSRYSALHSYPNPYEFMIDNCRVLCTSGQNISVLSQFTNPNLSFTDLMALTLKFRHLAPIAPDALACIPMQDYDPFIIDSFPHLYVVGNLGSYRTSTYEGVKIISIPRFSAPSHNIVLVNRFNLESKIVSFDSMI
ncbi:unnamed protein product [Blepharisma stoltei]|uniref:DNA polymerase delta small subunit n=1 Tax=Blepharisma stoltei TaxID=1481888 RepID=A0AAU9K2X0_9CILI|nr:unnamed protein product [Blepharisma stoltei]